MPGSRLAVVAVALVLAGCAASSTPAGPVPELPEVTPEEFRAFLAERDEPVVVNVWASWCLPCRSEAPLLATAARRFEGEVQIVALNVEDTLSGAQGFIAEFLADAPITHFRDPEGRIPPTLGAGPGIPTTLFFRPGGEPSTIHVGVIDERTLALEIDELLSP